MTRKLLLLAVVVGTAAPAVAHQDAFDLRQAVIHNSPADVGSWPADYAITSMTMDRVNGLRFRTDRAFASWPDYTPPGWNGPIQYTVWACVNVDGGWHCSGFIQMWRGRMNENGHPIPAILTDWNANYAYDGRWSPMNDYVPHAGDTVGFFFTAGNGRGVGGVTSVRSRTNVVTVRLPADDVGTFDFAAPTPTPAPEPRANPPLPSVDLSPILIQLGTLSSQVDALDAKVTQLADDEAAFRSDVRSEWKRVTGWVLTRVGPIVGGILAGRATK